MIYKEDYITAKGIKYKLYTLKGKILRMDYNTTNSFKVIIKSPDGVYTIQSNASGLRGYDISIINEFKIALKDDTKQAYLQSA